MHSANVNNYALAKEENNDYRMKSLSTPTIV